MVIWQMNFWQVIVAGGPIMLPIVLCSVLALAIIIDRCIYFAYAVKNTRESKQSIFELIKAGKILEAVERCDSTPSPMANIFKAGIIKYGTGRGEIKEAMEEMSALETPKFERHLNALATIAHAAVLLGLLGTVTGLCGTFYTIQMKSSSLHPVMMADLAAGIWEALITTVAGLLVGIPSFIAYNYFVHRVHTSVLELQRSAVALLAILSQVSDFEAAKTAKTNQNAEL